MPGPLPTSRPTTTSETQQRPPPLPSPPPRQRRRLFSIGSFRYQFPVGDRRRLVDYGIEVASWIVESVVYWLGPILIALASAIICLMLYAFLTILLPMIVRKQNAHSPVFGAIVIGSHCALVLYLLVQIVFNYYCCVVQKHSGPLYDRIVRELAEAMEFQYPETPEAIASHRRNVSDLLKVRIQRQREEAMRTWMLQGPFEWGYCPHTNQAKPPRSHYDHVVKALVLNLDHYCPWMFNAVGYLNYRYFVSFLIFVFIAMVYGSILLCEPFLLLKSKDFHQQWLMERQALKDGSKAVVRVSPMMPLRSEKLLVTLTFMLCVALGFAILVLGGFHIYLCLTSQTTIEFHGSWSHGSKRNKAKKNPYSVGRALGNWERVFGRNWLRSLLIPNANEPEFLPVPIPGHSGLRMKFSDGKLEADGQELESLINVV